jgi:hypothetical protein
MWLFSCVQWLLLCYEDRDETGCYRLKYYHLCPYRKFPKRWSLGDLVPSSPYEYSFSKSDLFYEATITLTFKMDKYT